MVGWREDGVGGELRLLVQNWWRDKQFFEVDLPYLVSRKAQLSWTTASQTSGGVVPRHPVVAATVAESQVTGVDTGLREVDLKHALGAPASLGCDLPVYLDVP